ncbi:sensor histidine kinase [Bacillus kwashiorkori]|uniref:sensor histidine kinase n=1 Tax=Bacillus kwashiorkori TaxID=1522318 RepID=UPI000783D773|nr:HAMP domain-containing sensor histidine kinase [Bacillus kwashiorkori]
MKLKNKINLYTSVFFISLVILINISIYFLFKNLMVQSEIATTEQEMMSIATGVAESLGEIPSNELLRAYVPVDGMIRIVVPTNKSDTTVTAADKDFLRNVKEVFYNKEIKEPMIVDKENYYFFSIPIIQQDGNLASLQVMKSIQTPYEQIKVLRVILFSVTLIIMIPIFISSRILSTIITKPITSLTKTMSEITESGKFKRISLEKNSSQELYQMGDTFNHMIDLLEANFKKQEQFIGNASHELKTPLTVIESYASLLKRRGSTDQAIFQESVEAIHSEAIRMREMTEQLLMLAKANENWKIELTIISLTDVLHKTVHTLQNSYRREIQLNILENIEVETDEQKFKQLLYILMENAIKYSQEKINIEVGLKNHQPYISIMDRGVGIPKEDIPKIFDRFYRVDEARTRKTGGTGLGLSLAKEIAVAINADIQVESTVGIGTNITVLLHTPAL